MVKILTEADRATIDAAIKTAEENTSARICYAVVAASYHYRDFALLTGFIIGSLLSLGIWWRGLLVEVPYLFVIQIVVMALFVLIPYSGRGCIKLLPRKIKWHHAAQRAFIHYYASHAQMPSDTPFVFLFVSQAERYVHVITNPVVHNKIPDNWQKVTHAFAATTKKHGLAIACTEAIADIGAILEIFQA